MLAILIFLSEMIMLAKVIVSGIDEKWFEAVTNAVVLGAFAVISRFCF